MKTIIIGSSSVVSVGDRAVDLAVVGLGGLEEHLFELAALLADGDHVDQQRRKDAALLERRAIAVAFADASRAASIASLSTVLLDDVLDDVERRQQRDAALQQRRKRAREARHGDFLQQLAEVRNAQQPAVEARRVRPACARR